MNISREPIYKFIIAMSFIIVLSFLFLPGRCGAQVYNGNFESGPFTSTTGWSYVKTTTAEGTLSLFNKSAPTCTKCSSDRALLINVTKASSGSVFMPINYNEYRQQVTPGTTRQFSFDYKDCIGPVQAAVRYWYVDGTKTINLLPFIPQWISSWQISPTITYVVPQGAKYSSPSIVFLGGTGSCRIDNLNDRRI